MHVKRLPEELAAKLDSIADDFLAQGADARMDAVATAIGVPRATLYYHFSGKDDLVTHFMRGKMQRVEHCIREALDGGGEPLDRFASALRAAAQELASNPAVCVNIMVAMGRMGAMEDLMLASDRQVLGPLREVLLEARAVDGLDLPDLDVTLSAIMGGIYMATVQQHARTGAVDPDAIADTVVAQALDGIRRGS